MRDLLLAAAVLFLGVPAAHCQTLGQLLQQNGVALDAGDALRGTRPITSYAVGRSQDHFAVAYYVGAGDTLLPDSLQVSLLDRGSGRWRHASIPRTTIRGAGSALRVTLSRSHVFVDTHLTPSAGTLLVLSVNLEVRQVLNGWTELLLPSGAMLYEQNTVHFAPTHPAVLRLYDPTSGRDTAIYPTQPYQTVRLTFIERVREIYQRLGADWFRLNNHHMMAEQFESTIGTPLADSSGTRIAFIAMFGEGGGSRSSPPVVEVLVVCRDLLTASRCSETELSALRIAEPGLSEDEILRRAVRTGG